MKAAKIILIILAAALAVIAVVSVVKSPTEQGLPAEPSSSGSAPALIAGLDDEPAVSTMLSGTKIGWGLGSDKNSLGQPVDAENAQQKYAELGAVFLTGEQKEITLTFDLGYENGYTEKILDTLKQHGVKGIFFITGEYLRSAPQIVERIIDEGHILGNHSLKHPSMPTISEAAAAAEITGLHRLVKEQFGYEMKLFRFPMGEFSEKTLAIANGLNYQSWFWSFAYRDWLTDNQPDPSSALQKVVGAAHPGAVYLLHAVSSTNTAIMGDIIKNLSEQGYIFTIPEV